MILFISCLLLNIFIYNVYAFFWFYKLIFYTCLSWKVSFYINVQWNVWRHVIRHSEWCVWGCICSKLTLRRRGMENTVERQWKLWSANGIASAFFIARLGGMVFLFSSFSSSHGYSMYRDNWIKMETYCRYTFIDNNCAPWNCL